MILLTALLLVQTSTATIHGTVARSGSGDAIAGAQISLTRIPPRPEQKPIPPVTSDNAGRFSFNNLEAGSYGLSAAMNGYARHSLPNIVAAEGQAVEGIGLRLTPAGNVNGNVRDPKGRPLAGAPVQLLRQSYDATGHRQFQPVARTKTDDRGQYRFYWATPGRYAVIAGTGADGLGLDFRNSDSNTVQTPLPYTFFPGDVDVKPGADRDGIDLVIAPSRLHAIRARVIDGATGKPPEDIGISVDYWTPRGAGRRFGGNVADYNPQTGMLVIEDLVPGAYDVGVAFDAISLLPGLGDVGPGTEGHAVVSDADVDLGTLTIKHPRSIRGKIEFDTPPTNDAWRAAIEIQLSRPERSGAVPDGKLSAVHMQVQPDNSLSATYPYETLRVTISELPAGYYVLEARLDGVDALSGQAAVAATGKLDIVLNSKGGRVDGVVRDARSQGVAGAAAVLVPNDRRGRPELFKQAISDQNGRFAIVGIAPGDYKLFAWENLEPFSYFDPQILQRYEDKGRPVRINESSRESFDVTTLPVESQ